MSSIELAIEEANSQESPNYTQIAKKYGVDCSRLSRRCRGKTGSTADGIENKSLLNKEQEKALLNEINRLSARGTPPTVTIVRSFTFNILGY